MYECGTRDISVAANDLFYFDAPSGHIVGNESSLCFATQAAPPPPSPPCSLNGEISGGACTCYEPWTGADCSTLDVLPAPPVRGYGMDPNIYTWGGSVALLDDGLYHMYVAEMSGNCSLNSWGSHSLVTHATSPTPEGPFVRQDTALPVWSHNVRGRGAVGRWDSFRLPCPSYCFSLHRSPKSSSRRTRRAAT